MELNPGVQNIGNSQVCNGNKTRVEISDMDGIISENLIELDHKHIDGPLYLTSYSASAENFDLNEENYQNEAQLINVSTISISDRRQCSLCNCSFVDRDQQIEHYKLDWHRLNLKQRMKGYEAISESQFNEMMNNQSDVSSISASESDDNSESEFSDQESGSQNNIKNVFNNIALSDRPEFVEVEPKLHQMNNYRRKCKLYFKNSTGDILSIQRCLLHGKHDIPECETDLVSRVKCIYDNLKWAIILIGGGHFAAGIFNKDIILNHKTFHRYTVRAKQGSSQNQRDMKNGGSHSKSAGASLRRYNEASLILDIQNLLSSWKDELSQCSIIFYRASSFNRSILFGNKNPPFLKDDKQLRNIPFPTRRATLHEVKRIHQCLMTIEIIPKGSELNEKISSNFQPEYSTEVNKHNSVPTDVDAKHAQINNLNSPKPNKKKRKKIKKQNIPSNIEKHKSEPCFKLEDDDEEVLIFNELYTLCKNGNLQEFNSMIGRIPTTSLHKIINKQFGFTNSTLLHTTAKDGSRLLVNSLLHHGADPTIVNNQQQPPFVLAKDIETKSVFQEFKKEFPDKYEYELSKIPNVEAKAKKKKPKRKIKNRIKDTDRSVEVNNGEKNLDCVICDFCKVNISSKVPFECYNLKFCTTDCVRKFRTRQILPK